MRYKELDALRGLAALAVVLYHYTTQYGKMFGHKETLAWQASYGDLGVHLFFMISGFVIFLTVNHIKQPKHFVISRFARLYPSYWAAIILTTTVVWIFGLSGEERNLVVTLANFSMLQGIFEIPDVDGVYWTLMYELIFYGLILILLMLKQLKHISVYIFIGLLLNILNSQVAWIPWKIQLFLILKFNHLFAAGILFYVIKKEGISIGKASLLSLCLAAQWFQDHSIHSVIISVFFIIFVLFIYEKLTFLSVKALTWLGAISYSLYLLHQNIGYVLIRELQHLDVNIYLSIGCAIILSLTLAHYVTALIEKPCQKWIKQKFTSY